MAQSQVNYELLRLLHAVSESPGGRLKFTIDGQAVSTFSRLRKLKNLGWVTRSSGDGWTVTNSGKQKLAESDDWEWNVSGAASVPRLDAGAFTYGELRRGLPRDGDPCWITRDGVLSGQGVLHSVRAIYNPHGGPPTIFLHTEGDLPIKGDVLTHRPRPDVGFNLLHVTKRCANCGHDVERVLEFFYGRRDQDHYALGDAVAWWPEPDRNEGGGPVQGRAWLPADSDPCPDCGYEASFADFAIVIDGSRLVSVVQAPPGQRFREDIGVVPLRGGDQPQWEPEPPSE